jgi:hypothetical protein
MYLNVDVCKVSYAGLHKQTDEPSQDSDSYQNVDDLVSHTSSIAITLSLRALSLSAMPPRTYSQPSPVVYFHLVDQYLRNTVLVRDPLG